MNALQSNTNALVASIVKMGLTHAVICPGSRNAPIVMALTRHSGLTCFSVVDERSAAFTALGMAKSLNQTVALCCTSGSALLNMYPAVAEAYYMQVPLLIISADRPPELIDRWDGQAIHQEGVFGRHVKSSFSATGPEDHFINCGVQAMHLSTSGVNGPVHINLPLAEPLYAEAAEQFIYPDVDVSAQTGPAGNYSRGFSPGNRLKGKHKILVLCGAGDPNPKVAAILKRLGTEKQIPVCSDVISGVHAGSSHKNWETLLLGMSAAEQQAMVPDVLISTGKMLLNKTFRNLLKNNKPAVHWHIAENGYSADPYFTEPLMIAESEAVFLQDLLASSDVFGEASFYERWAGPSAHAAAAARTAIGANPYGEFAALRSILASQTAENLVLHAANSMSVRLLAYASDLIQDSWEVHANRGVSGIDGCSSTAVGMAICREKPNLLFTGELAFFYDANAFLSAYLPQNLKIVVLNNSGGGIFLNIDGPAKMPEANPYLLTPHTLSAAHLAAMYQMDYLRADSRETLEQVLPVFNAATGLCILEVFTDMQSNSDIFKQFKSIQI